MPPRRTIVIKVDGDGLARRLDRLAGEVERLVDSGIPGLGDEELREAIATVADQLLTLRDKALMAEVLARWDEEVPL